VVESSKYPSQQLTEEDKEVLDKVFLKYAITFYNLMQEFPDPKDCAKKVLSKATQGSDRYFAGVYMLAYIKNAPDNQFLEPGEINKKLANDIKDRIQQDLSIEVRENESNPKGLHPRDLSEILKKFEENGILVHFEGKKEITDQLHKTHRDLGKKSLLSFLTQHSSGGKLSVYLVKEDIEKLKRAIEKPEALEYLHTKTVRSGVAHKIMKYCMLMCFYTIKMDEDVALKLVGAGATFFQDKMDEQQQIEFHKMHQTLQLVDDVKLEQYVDDLTKSLIHERGYYVILFIQGLLQL
jgi:hypothetical protein